MSYRNQGTPIQCQNWRYVRPRQSPLLPLLPPAGADAPHISLYHPESPDDRSIHYHTTWLASLEWLMLVRASSSMVGDRPCSGEETSVAGTHRPARFPAWAQSSTMS